MASPFGIGVGICMEEVEDGADGESSSGSWPLEGGCSSLPASNTVSAAVGWALPFCRAVIVVEELGDDSVEVLADVGGISPAVRSVGADDALLDRPAVVLRTTRGRTTCISALLSK